MSFKLRCAALAERVEMATVAMAVMFVTSPAYAQTGLEGLSSKIQQFNNSLIAVGGFVTVTGFIWAVVSIALGLAGAAKAVVVLIAGLCIAAAPQIVGFFTRN